MSSLFGEWLHSDEKYQTSFRFTFVSVDNATRIHTLQRYTPGPRYCNDIQNPYITSTCDIRSPSVSARPLLNCLKASFLSRLCDAINVNVISCLPGDNATTSGILL